MNIRSLIRSLRLHTHYGHCELFLQRFLFALLVFTVVSGVPTYTTQPEPNGLANYIDFTALANERLHTLLCAGLAIALALYVFRWAMPYALGYVFVLAVSKGTLANSQGAIGHGTQIVSLIVLGQLLAYSYGTFLKWRHRQFRPGEQLTIDDLAVYFTQQMIASAYVVAALAKLGRSGFAWIAEVKYIAVDITKTHAQHYLMSLTSPEIVERGEYIANFIAKHPTLTQVVFGAGLFLELFAFVALLNRKMAMATGIALLAMHQAILWVMGLPFTNNKLVLLIYFVNVPFVVLEIGKRISAKCKASRHAAGMSNGS